jgi:hypothetical protein
MFHGRRRRGTKVGNGQPARLQPRRRAPRLRGTRRRQG